MAEVLVRLGSGRKVNGADDGGLERLLVHEVVCDMRWRVCVVHIVDSLPSVCTPVDVVVPLLDREPLVGVSIASHHVEPLWLVLACGPLASFLHSVQRERRAAQGAHDGARFRARLHPSFGTHELNQ